MGIKALVIVTITIGLAGCALFGVFSLNKGSDQEVIEVKRSIIQAIKPFQYLSFEQMQAIMRIWKHAGDLFRADMKIYTGRYNRQAGQKGAVMYSPEDIWIRIFRQLVRLYPNGDPTAIHHIQDIIGEYPFPEGCDYATYDWLVTAHMPLLGFVRVDLQQPINEDLG